MFAAPVALAPVPAAPVPAPVPAAPVAPVAAPVALAAVAPPVRAPVAPVPNAADAAASRDAFDVEAGTLLFSTLTPVKNPAAPTAASASTSVAIGSLRRRVFGSGGGGGSSKSGAKLEATPLGESYPTTFAGSVLCWVIRFSGRGFWRIRVAACRASLVSQCFDGQQSRCPTRWVEPEEKAGHYRHREGEYHGVVGHHGLDADDPEMAATNACGHADETADGRQQHRLDQELPQDVGTLRTDRLADADLACSLGHRHEHDVHDADAADQQADSSDYAEERGEHLVRRRGRLQQACLVENSEVISSPRGDAVRGLKSRCHLGLRVSLLRRRRSFDVDAGVRRAVPGQSVLYGRQRRHHHVVLVLNSVRALRLQQPDG